MALWQEQMLFVKPMQTKVIFDFNKDSNISGWKVADDVLMGGVSSGTFILGPDGYGLFEGEVSLAKNGGFFGLIPKWIFQNYSDICSISFRTIFSSISGDN